MKPSRKNKWNNDPYTRLAKQKGYPARSIFKLEEIQRKYSIIKKGDHVLDIGAAPGSWSLYVSRILDNKGKIIGVDLQPLQNNIHLPPIFHFIRGDIFHTEILDSLIRKGPYNVILSDAAPSTTGNRLIDSTRSWEIAKRILEIVEKCLKKGGNLVVKIFQGEDTGDILKKMKGLFTIVKANKPTTSRKKSTEQYYIGCKYNETH